MSTSSTLSRHLRDLRKLLKLPVTKSYTARRFLPRACVLVLSPHPDDEVLMGALALRLQEENGAQVINVAVTLGSKVERQKPRLQELARAIKLLHWKSVLLTGDWSAKQKRLASLIKRHRPALIIAPHEHDHHPAHVQTAKILQANLRNFTGHVAWAEYWNPQRKPNLLIEVSDQQHLAQVAALECHAGEVARNPYHVRLMGWQIDSVRRGSEWLAQKGAPSASMLLGQLYRLEKWEEGKKKAKSVVPFATLKDDLTDWLQ